MEKKQFSIPYRLSKSLVEDVPFDEPRLFEDTIYEVSPDVLVRRRRIDGVLLPGRVAHDGEPLRCLCTYRFFRRVSSSVEYGTVKLDQLLFGIVATVKATDEQFANLFKLLGPLQHCAPKFRQKMNFDRNPIPIAENLYGPDLDDLEDEEEDAGSDKEEGLD